MTNNAKGNIIVSIVNFSIRKLKFHDKMLVATILHTKIEISLRDFAISHWKINND